MSNKRSSWDNVNPSDDDQRMPAKPPSQPTQVGQLPPCRASCPSGADVRGWVTTIAQRKRIGLSDEEAYTAAWKMIVAVNPFPAVMGRVCPHPCESGCNRLEKDGAVAVNQLERFIGDWALEKGLQHEVLESEPKPESVGVIGAGPASLSFAYQMARRGYSVTVYERYPKPGGMLRYGIPVYRLPEAVLDAEIQRIVDLGVKLELDTRIGRDVTAEELQARHQVLFLGIGAQRALQLGVPGEAGAGVWSGTDYLSRINQGEKIHLGRRVAVIGGGDTAIDAARAARRGGSEVTLLYRRTRREMPAIDSEIEEALRERIRLEYLVAPVAILRGDDDLPRSLTVQRMSLGDPDESGRRQPIPIEGSEYEIPVDGVVAAISQQPDWDGLDHLRPHKDSNWIGADERGRVDDRFWAGGDVLNLGIASAAIFHGRLAAESVHGRLRGQPVSDLHAPDPIRMTPAKVDYYGEKARLTPRQLPVEDWLADPNAEIHQTITEEQFQEEVARCLSCGQCFGCEHCWMYCAHGCFSRLEEVGPGRYFSVALDRCQACGKCIDVCPCGFLRVRNTEEAA